MSRRTTQLSSGRIMAMTPSNWAVVQFMTWSWSPRICRVAVVSREVSLRAEWVYMPRACLRSLGSPACGTRPASRRRST